MQKLKESLKADLPARLTPFKKLLKNADERLWNYCLYVLDKKHDHANIYEICALRDFASKLEANNITFDAKSIQKKLRAFERLKSDTMYGSQTITATIQQVYIFANIYGFYVEKNGKNVRLVTDADLFIPRKFGKTHIGAFAAYLDFFSGDNDAEIYCCANAQSQAKRAFNATRDFIHQTVGPESGLVRFTATEVNWIEGNKYGRKASLNLLSAGGKAKDGLKASFRFADEYGSAAYVKDHSDMDNLVKVIDSSMGPRFSPLRLTTTTAGRISSGPYMLRLEALQTSLINGTMPPETFAYILQPDPWEITDEELCLNSPTIWKKVNPHIGITIQPDFYEKEVERVRLDPDYRKEFFAKLLNIFQTDKAIDWIKPDEIRELQVDRTIDDCTYDDGWMVFVGLDFSMGDDLHAISYLAVRENEEGTGMEFFADCDAWITEHTMNNDTMGDLFKVWVEKGSLHLSPGKTLEPTLPVKRIAELYDKGVVFYGFGYDSYKAKPPINALAAWLVEITGDNKAPKDYIVPVSQTYASYNPVVEEMDYMVKSDPPLISFSKNPLFPYEFGCCYLDEDPRMGNKKPIKKGSGNVDNVQALLSACMMYDRAEGREQK